MILLYIVGWCMLGLLGGLVAARKGYNLPTWILLAIVFGPVSILISMLLPETAEERQQSELDRQLQAEGTEFAERKRCPQCGREVSVRAPACPRCEHRFE